MLGHPRCTMKISRYQRVSLVYTCIVRLWLHFSYLWKRKTNFHEAPEKVVETTECIRYHEWLLGHGKWCWWSCCCSIHWDLWWKDGIKLDKSKVQLLTFFFEILLKTNKCLAIQGVRDTATFILNFCHPIKISAKTPKQFQLMPSGNSNCNCL